VSTPGLVPEGLAFVIGEGLFVVTGDLDGGRGVRMVPGPVDQEAWRASAARVQAAAPDVRWLGGHPSPVDTPQ
jgi:glyoxylase-like metal-dependent hydrolase (beta-lactamase superfamily II)